MDGPCKTEAQLASRGGPLIVLSNINLICYLYFVNEQKLSHTGSKTICNTVYLGLLTKSGPRHNRIERTTLKYNVVTWEYVL